MSTQHVNAAYDLTAFQQHLLRVIQGLHRPKGLTVKEELESVYGVSINHGRLYPNLDTLVRKGYVEKGTKDQRTNEYVLTRRGERELEELQTWFAGDLDV